MRPTQESGMRMIQEQIGYQEQEMDIDKMVRQWRDHPISSARDSVKDIGLFLGMHETGTTPRRVYTEARKRIREVARAAPPVEACATLEEALSITIGVAAPSGAGKGQLVYGFSEMFENDYSLYFPDPDTKESALNGYNVQVIPVPFSMYTQAAKLSGLIDPNLGHGQYGDSYATISSLMRTDMLAARRLFPRDRFLVFVVEGSSPTAFPVVEDGALRVEGVDRGLSPIYAELGDESRRDDTFLFLLNRGKKVAQFAAKGYRPNLDMEELRKLEILNQQQKQFATEDKKLYDAHEIYIREHLDRIFREDVNIIYPHMMIRPEKSHVVKAQLNNMPVPRESLIKLAQFLHVTMASPGAIERSDQQLAELLQSRSMSSMKEYYDYIRRLLVSELRVRPENLGIMNNPYVGYVKRPFDIKTFLNSLPVIGRPSMNRWVKEMVHLPGVIIPDVQVNLEE